MLPVVYTEQAFTTDECKRIVDNLDDGVYGYPFKEAGVFRNHADTDRLHFFVLPKVRRAFTQQYDKAHNELQWIRARIESHIDKYQSIYGKVIHRLDFVSGFQFVKYSSTNNGFHTWHTDKARPSRMLSLSVQLTDPSEYEGGKLTFENTTMTRSVALAQGSINIFPSDAVHMVSEITNGTRYALVMWAEEYIGDTPVVNFNMPDEYY